MLYDKSNYMCSDDGFFLPLGYDYLLPQAGRATLYLIGLLWAFLGIAIFTEVFMQAISTITSNCRCVKIPDPDDDENFVEVELRIWNDTVANLTLIALGSSAPEILLNMIEIFGNTFISGDLGPSTIVGSAAFNFMFITGLCIISIPKNESRRIRLYKVFIVTSLFSILAYVWLVIILVVVSPNFVELWEAALTLVMFPLLVVVAYMTDKDYCMRRPVEDETLLIGLDDDNLLTKGEADKDFISELMKRLRHETDMKDDVAAQLSAYLMEQHQSHDRSWYRINAIRLLTGSSRMTVPITKKVEELVEELCIQQEVGELEDADKAKESRLAVIEFDAASTAVLEREKHVSIKIKRHGNKTGRVIFRVETIDGTAEAMSDYVPFKETLVFEPNKTERQIQVRIIDDKVWGPDEMFFVRLLMEPNQKAKLGSRAVTQVVILNDDEPGTFSFTTPSHMFKESIGVVTIPVQRQNGSDGKVSVKWKTKDITAIAGYDYRNTEGELLFDHGETTKMIEIVIIDEKEFEKDECFEITLTGSTGGALIGKLKRTVVTIINDDEYSSFVSRVTELTNINLDALRLQRKTWGQQFTAALNVNGGDLQNATVFSNMMHIFSFFWKLIAAFIPPPSLFKGWPCFFVSLFLIGLLTTFVVDLATIFGCLTGLKPELTAITFIAIGTNLPDLFASRQAAIHEKYADNAIGNITGSTSVNVFFGLGLPWVIAAIFWTTKGGTFEVKAEVLGYSVIIYTCCAAVTIILLTVRRNVQLFGEAELGGHSKFKIIFGIILMLLWFLYILLTTIQLGF